jgi:surfeit locus 1 family protein
MSRYRFARRPWWVVSHVFVLSLMLLMVRLGLWQVDRLSEKRERNAVVEQRTSEPPADVRDLAGPEAYASFESADALEYRQATATGTYLVDQEVIVRSRSYQGAAGSWVLTPLELDDGTIAVVNRGWIANSGQFDAVPEDRRAPEGEVTASGIVRLTEERGSFGATDPADGVLTDLARADIGRLAQQLDGEVLPFYLQLLEQEPEVTGDDPIPVPAPELDEGPHLSYAVQWFTFTAMTAVVYALILRKKRDDDERGRRIAADEGEADVDPAPVPSAAS